MIIDRDRAYDDSAKRSFGHVDLFGATIRDTIVLTKVSGKKISDQGMKILDKMTQEGAVDKLTDLFSETIDRRYAYFYSLAFVKRAKALKEVGRYDYGDVQYLKKMLGRKGES
jgi:hypothetical protein